jgi:hypothetical protein
MRDSSTPVDVVGFGAVTATAVLVSRSVTVTPARVAAVKLRCGSAAPCRGVLRLSASTALGAGTFGIAAGRTSRVEIRLTVRGFGLLVRSKSLSATARITCEQAAGGATTVTSTLLLRAPGR